MEKENILREGDSFMSEEASRRGRSARNKGGRGELEIAHILRDTYGYDTKRGYVFYHQSDVVGLPGIHMEVKRVERLNISTAMKQALNEANIKRDGIPTLFHRRNREGWLVTMRLEDWMDLYGEWVCRKKDG